MSLFVPFATVMNMTYDQFHETFASCDSDFELVSVTNVEAQEKPVSLILCEGVYSDFLDWAYFNRHLLAFLSIKDMFDLAPTFYSHEKQWYMVNQKDMSYKHIHCSISPPVLRRSTCRMEEIQDCLNALCISEEWTGPFVVSPHIYLDEKSLREYLASCVSLN